MSEDAYSRAGVDQGAADGAVGRLVAALAAGEARGRLAPGPAPGPLRERDQARRADRDRALDRRRRDQAARRRAARPLRHGRHRLHRDERQRRDLRRRRAAGDARLHRVDRADPDVCEEIGEGWRAAPSWPGSRSRAASWRSSARWSPGLDLAGACFGMVALDAIVDGSAVEPGDPVIGLPSSGLHSNGYTLARTALEGVPLDRRAPRPAAGRGAARADRDLRQAGARAAALGGRRARARPHHLGRARQPAAAAGRGRLRDRRPARAAAGVRADRASSASVPEEEMYEVFNMGCGFCCVVAAADEERRSSCCAAHYPEAKTIGRADEGAESRRTGCRGRDPSAHTRSSAPCRPRS